MRSICGGTNIGAYYRGTVVSIIAAILIAILLVESLVSGFKALFEGASIFVMLALISLGVLAAYYYWGVDRLLSVRVKALAPLVLGIALIGVLTGVFLNPLIGGGLIVLAYFLEAGIGVPLYRLSLSCSRVGAQLFISGVLFFTLTLPLVVVNKMFSVLPLLGDIVKLVGLIILAVRARPV